MFKITLLIALAVAGACAQETSNGAEAAPEPYSYGYETDTHAASEQRDPSGKVTGFYTLVDGDGRQRRVEYVADESGFRAKVQTNEVGTKSENSADVEVLASPPNAEQYVVKTQTVQQQAPAVRYVQQPQQQLVSYQQVPQQQLLSSYAVQQPQYASYGYYPGYGAGYGYGSYGVYGSYNNHLPSSYYRSLQTVPAGSYSVGNGLVGRYVQGGVTSQTVQPVGGSYRRYSTVSGPATYSTSGYQTVGIPTVGYQARSAVGSSSNLLGSSNYIVLKKRQSESATEGANKKRE